MPLKIQRAGKTDCSEQLKATKRAKQAIRFLSWPRCSSTYQGRFYAAEETSWEVIGYLVMRTLFRKSSKWPLEVVIEV